MMKKATRSRHRDRTIKFMLITDDPGQAQLIHDMVLQIGDVPFELEQAKLLSTGLEHLSANNIDVVLLDLMLPDSRGIKTFRNVHHHILEVPIIILSSVDDKTLAIKAVQEGAQDYLFKGQIDSNLLERSLRNAIERNRIQKKLHRSKQHANAKYKKLIETASDAIFIADTETGKIIDANKKAEKLLGLPIKKIIGMHQTQLHPKEEAVKYAKIFQEHIRKRKKIVLDTHVVNNEGRKIPVEINANVTTIAGKKVIQGIFRDITQRKQAEKEIKRKSQIQSLFNKMLNISMQPYSLEEMLEHILEPIDSISWLALQSRGVVFLTEDEPNILFLKSCRNIPEELQIMCNQVPFGKCICGKAALTRKIQFADSVDIRHEIGYKGMPPHGHYCVPILSSDKLLGVLNFYTREGYCRKKEDEAFLTAMANVLGGIIERKKAEEELKKHRQHLQKLVEERTAALTKVTEELKKEIAERKQAQEILHQNMAEMTALHTLSRQINASLSLDPVLKAISKGLMDTINPDLALIFLCKDNELILIKAQSRNGKIPSETFPVHRFGECLCGLAYSKGKPMYSYNIHTDLRCTWEECKKSGFQSFVALPLKSGEEVIGILGLASLENRDFSKQASFLEALSNEIAIGLQHALLYEERRIAEEKLRKEKNFTDVIINSLPGIFYLFDEKTNILHWNHNAESISGYTAEEISRMCVADFINKEDRGLISEKIKKAFVEGKAVAEAKFLTKTGEKIPFYFTGLLMVLDNQKYILGMGIDITERKKNEKMLRARQKEIEKLNASLEKRVQEEVEKSRQKDIIMMHQSRLAAMGQMIGNIAHQWRQPLNTLNLVLYNIKDFFYDEIQNKKRFDEFITTGNRVVLKMSTTIDDFRNFFKPDQEKEKFSINQIIKDSLSLVETSFKHYNISIIEEEKKEVYAVGFPNEYSQVIFNIMNNAKDAILDRGVNGEIRIDVCSKNNSAVVKIRNNGGIIPENNLNKIFDPYFTTKEPGKGTGLGLYMAKIIIEEHMHGHINVENIEDGAEFDIQLPVSF